MKFSVFSEKNIKGQYPKSLCFPQIHSPVNPKFISPLPGTRQVNADWEHTQALQNSGDTGKSLRTIINCLSHLGAARKLKT